MPALAAIFGCHDTTLSQTEAAFFREADPWGFILFARNVDSPDQVRRLTSDLRNAVGRDAPVLIDQEGGRVQRLRAPHWREWRAPLLQMEDTAPDAALRSMFLRYRLIAAELRAVGIDVNCAPLGDLAEPETHPVLRNRCYGSDPETVAAAARAVAHGLIAGGVLPILKHIPGHGRAHADSHVDLPIVTTDAEDLWDTDFATFMALTDLPMAMTAHVVYQTIDPKAPATISPTMIRLIRDEIGFHGLLMTDDISMQALQGTIAERSRAAMKAGCDMILHCNGNSDQMAEVVAEAGVLTPAAVARTDAALALRRAPDNFDPPAAEAELAALLGEKTHG